MKNKQTMIIVLIFFILYVWIMPRVYWYFQQDLCLDEGGSWNKLEHTCDKSTENSDGK